MNHVYMYVIQKTSVKYNAAFTRFMLSGKHCRLHSLTQNLHRIWTTRAKAVLNRIQKNVREMQQYLTTLVSKDSQQAQSFILAEKQNGTDKNCPN